MRQLLVLIFLFFIKLNFIQAALILEPNCREILKQRPKKTPCTKDSTSISGMPEVQPFLNNNLPVAKFYQAKTGTPPPPPPPFTLDSALNEQEIILFKNILEQAADNHLRQIMLNFFKAFPRAMDNIFSSTLTALEKPLNLEIETLLRLPTTLNRSIQCKYGVDASRCLEPSELKTESRRFRQIADEIDEKEREKARLDKIKAMAPGMALFDNESTHYSAYFALICYISIYKSKTSIAEENPVFQMCNQDVTSWSETKVNIPLVSGERDPGIQQFSKLQQAIQRGSTTTTIAGASRESILALSPLMIETLKGNHPYPTEQVSCETPLISGIFFQYIERLRSLAEIGECLKRKDCKGSDIRSLTQLAPTEAMEVIVEEKDCQFFAPDKANLPKKSLNPFRQGTRITSDGRFEIPPFIISRSGSSNAINNTIPHALGIESINSYSQSNNTPSDALNTYYDEHFYPQLMKDFKSLKVPEERQKTIAASLKKLVTEGHWFHLMMRLMELGFNETRDSLEKNLMRVFSTNATDSNPIIGMGASSTTRKITIDENLKIYAIEKIFSPSVLQDSDHYSENCFGAEANYFLAKALGISNRPLTTCEKLPDGTLRLRQLFVSNSVPAGHVFPNFSYAQVSPNWKLEEVESTLLMQLLSGMHDRAFGNGINANNYLLAKTPDQKNRKILVPIDEAMIFSLPGLLSCLKELNDPASLNILRPFLKKLPEEIFEEIALKIMDGIGITNRIPKYSRPAVQKSASEEKIPKARSVHSLGTAAGKKMLKKSIHMLGTAVGETEEKNESSVSHLDLSKVLPRASTASLPPSLSRIGDFNLPPLAKTDRSPFTDKVHRIILSAKLLCLQELKNAPDDKTPNSCKALVHLIPAEKTQTESGMLTWYEDITSNSEQFLKFQKRFEVLFLLPAETEIAKN